MISHLRHEDALQTHNIKHSKKLLQQLVVQTHYTITSHV